MDHCVRACVCGCVLHMCEAGLRGRRDEAQELCMRTCTSFLRRLRHSEIAGAFSFQASSRRRSLCAYSINIKAGEVTRHGRTDSRP
jgi:hypothetical protein